MDKYSFLGAVHSNMIEMMYDQYIQNPDSVDEGGAAFFKVSILQRRFTLRMMRFQKLLRKNFVSLILLTPIVQEDTCSLRQILFVSVENTRHH